MLYKNWKKGFVGVAATLALGVALGTAVMVVSKEMIKSSKENKTLKHPTASPEHQDAYINYEKALRNYEKAIKENSPQQEAYRLECEKSKKELELSLFKNIPGITQKDLEPCSELHGITPQSDSIQKADEQFHTQEADPFGVLTEELDSSAKSNNKQR
ncbi:MAG: hypothetical protein GX221_10515 [Candidatus Riflebacteria bacterium]|nr:hypothetical protein [Candidatus Riflebacteria bacterium]